MATCQLCEKNFDPDDLYKADEKEVCEECMFKLQNPPRPCGGGPGSSHSG